MYAQSVNPNILISSFLYFSSYSLPQLPSVVTRPTPDDRELSERRDWNDSTIEVLVNVVVTSMAAVDDFRRHASMVIMTKIMEDNIRRMRAEFTGVVVVAEVMLSRLKGSTPVSTVCNRLTLYVIPQLCHQISNVRSKSPTRILKRTIVTQI